MLENAPNVPRKRWGRLKQAVLFCLIDKPEAKIREMAAYRWDAEPTRQQLRSLRRAARQIAEHVGRGLWRLRVAELLP